MFVHFKFCLLSLSIIFSSACSSKLAAPDLSRFPAAGGTVSLDYKANRIAGIDFEFYSIGLIEYPKNQEGLAELTEPMAKMAVLLALMPDHFFEFVCRTDSINYFGRIAINWNYSNFGR
jgi:hypothetical protein